jgi:hypothetical protein
VTALGKDPVQQKRPSLGASFNLKRTAVPDVPGAAPTPEAVTPGPSPQPLDEAATTEAAGRTQAEAQERPRYQAPTSPGDPGKADKGLTLRMPKSLYDRFKARKEREGISYPNLMFTAVSKTHKRLPELLATSTIDLAKDEDNLFDLPTAVSKVSDLAKEATEDLPMRVTAHNIQVLDNLKATYNAPSRNHLIITCIDAYLEETP